MSSINQKACLGLSKRPSEGSVLTIVQKQRTFFCSRWQKKDRILKLAQMTYRWNLQLSTQKQVISRSCAHDWRFSGKIAPGHICLWQEPKRNLVCYWGWRWKIRAGQQKELKSFPLKSYISLANKNLDIFCGMSLKLYYSLEESREIVNTSRTLQPVGYGD